MSDDRKWTQEELRARADEMGIPYSPGDDLQGLQYIAWPQPPPSNHEIAVGRLLAQRIDLERQLAETQAELANLRDWAKVANQFAWAHEKNCPRHDADEPCNCGLDQFLSRPRVVVESYRQQLAAVEHELQEERAKRRADVQDLLGAISKFSEQAQP